MASDSFKRETVRALIAALVIVVAGGILYPLVMTGVGQVVFPHEVNGSQITVGGKVIGSELIGQSFQTPVYKHGKLVENEGVVETTPDPRYFQSRPSATEGGEYNAAASTFSNLGPNSVATKEAISKHIKAYIKLNRPYYPGLRPSNVPVDAANSSASGLDPEISVANARIQAHRVAALRHLALGRVLALIPTYTSSRFLGFSGEEGVNVLELNLALDRMQGGLASGR
ncbi:MAG TPA: potassium-transporting ATPase subunit C [Solirubrobacteraceae bacterium]|nr:potassium-transporting ATPase subunit C [Solirubrobacteraceae bacterium]